MSLNIKNEEAHRLARELAEATGESMTQAVTEALRERLARVRQREDSPEVERLLAMGRAIGERLDPYWRSIDHGELLYDEKGLPR
ncbi:type II toxin-antitoxin system VapB family antitoxin [Actinopolymorpha sp. B11F2]|uniref:type II toxin-antitoxin system VapB family antitoxin n=1 Tax=Actinopolymorpha sp. B11F2 TaxID=3160862 RepID=UPI0032E4FAE3